MMITWLRAWWSRLTAGLALVVGRFGHRGYQLHPRL